MCWNTSDDGNCDQCQNIFDNCKHDSTYELANGKLKCIFCEKTESKKGDWDG